MTTMFSIAGSMASGKLRKMTIDNIRDGKYAYERNRGYSYQHIIGRDAFETEDEARLAALAARDKKLLSLEKQIAKLKRMTFEQVKDATQAHAAVEGE